VKRETVWRIVLRIVEEMEASGEKESRKTKENMERYSKEGFEVIRSE
jgi:hypothetical protein